MAGDSNKAILAAFFANLGIAIAKFIAFAFTGSSSMLAEGVHSVADTGNQGLLMLGGRRARKAPTPKHPFGYGRERYFWSFIVALVLFTLGSAFALFEGIKKIRDPHEIDSPAWAIGVLLFAIVLESYSMRTAVVQSRPLLAGRTWWQFIRRSKEPELPVVLLEDLGALTGLMIALGAVTLSVTTDDGLWDGVGTLLIGVLLGAIAIVLAVEMKSLLIGEAASAKEAALINEAFESSPEVSRLIHIRTQHIAPDELLVGAKVEFVPTLEGPELAAAVDAVEARVRAAVPIATAMYIEPDVGRGQP